MAGKYRKVYRATFLVNKKEGISDEEFKRHYTEIHGPLFHVMGSKHGVLDYNLHFCTETERNELKEILGDAVVVIDADVIVTVTFPSRKALVATFQDPDYAAILKPDEDNFQLRARKMTIGDEWIVLHDGVEF